MKRRKFIYQSSLGLGSFLPVINTLKSFEMNDGPFLTSGIKIGEVTDSEAIVWVRLTRDPQRIGKPALIPAALYLDETDQEWHPANYFKEKYKEDRPDKEVKLIYPKGYDITNIEGAVPGAGGEARILFRKNGLGKWSETHWVAVDDKKDYTAQIKLQQLMAGSSYQIKAEVRASKNKTASASLLGEFKTAPNIKQPENVHFMVTTCHEYNHQDDPQGKGFKIYQHMQSLHPDFMVHTGDVVYYDQLAKDLALANWHWQRMFSLSNCVDFYKQVPCYFIKDDHDTWMNDCYPGFKNRFMGKFTFEQGVQVFKNQVPSSEKPYRTFRWGKQLQIWLPEGREFRDSNDIPDNPEKTIWGKEQMQWFKESFSASDATYKILVSPTPILGPDRPKKKDNHANAGFAHEGAVIKKFLSGKKNVFIVCGDRHWQYVSKDKGTGLMEFSCGPASDEHAEGWIKGDIRPEHHYLNIVGGFLGIEIKAERNSSKIIFTHYSVDGEKLYSENFSDQI